MQVYFWHRPRAWLVVILLGVGMILATPHSAVTADQLLTYHQVVTPTDGCGGSHGSGHAWDCPPACGSYCQALLPGAIDAASPRSGNFSSMAEAGVSGCIGRPEPHPPKIRFA